MNNTSGIYQVFGEVCGLHGDIADVKAWRRAHDLGDQLHAQRHCGKYARRAVSRPCCGDNWLFIYNSSLSCELLRAFNDRCPISAEQIWLKLSQGIRNTVNFIINPLDKSIQVSLTCCNYWPVMCSAWSYPATISAATTTIQGARAPAERPTSLRQS